VQQVTILENGQLSDSVVLNSIESLRKDVPDLDDTAVEAHMTLFRAYAVYFDALSSRYEDLGLSHARFNMIRWLYHAPGNRLSMTELGAYLEASVPNVIRMVEGLQTDAWVCRVESETDRRVTYVQLTPEGLSRFRAMLPRALEIWEEVQSGLSSDEQAMLSHLLTKLRMSLLSRYMGTGDLMSFRLEKRNRKRAAKAKRPAATATPT
jgi:DNA-binding MarR family transcriptional regulator